MSKGGPARRTIGATLTNDAIAERGMRAISKRYDVYLLRVTQVTEIVQGRLRIGVAEPGDIIAFNPFTKNITIHDASEAPLLYELA